MKTTVKYPEQKNPHTALSRIFGNDFLYAWNGDDPHVIPAMHMKEERKCYRIEMSVPGFKKNDFHIYVKDNMLNITCKKNAPGYVQHRFTGSIRKNITSVFRSFALPFDADINRMRAKYNGTLFITIQKRKPGAMA